MTIPGASVPSIEFLLPYLGEEDLLREAVTSVLHQTDQRWSLTVVEDGPQGTAVGSWLRDLEDSRIRYLLNSHTLGVAANFQRCLMSATADHVAFLGCDDRLKPNYVTAMRHALAKYPQIAVIQPGVQVIDALGCPVTPPADRLKAFLTPSATSDQLLGGEPLLVSLMRGNWTYFPSLLWRRQRLRAVGFRQDLHTVLDLYALATLILNDEDILVIADSVFEYRRHSASASSLSAATTARFVEERSAFKEIEIQAQARGWRRAALASRMRVASRLHAALLLPTALRARNWSASGRYLKHSLGR